MTNKLQIQIPEKELVRSVISVYLVGLVGFLIPYSHDFFVALTPLTLLFSLVVLLLAVRKSLTPKSAIVFIAIYLLGFFIEAIGVNTGWPFGEYAYGSVLGIKWLQTPLFIGVNWLLLVLASHLIAAHRAPNRWLIPFIGATLMLIFDVALEPFAINTGMWVWSAASVPIANYIAWWLIAFAMHWILLLKPYSTGYRVGYAVFLAQIVFFMILNMVNLIQWL
ncbi:MAG: carotenoid biosynthesis protein [Salinivirgaceae bacterium]